jgi:hypothetical protein
MDGAAMLTIGCMNLICAYPVVLLVFCRLQQVIVTAASEDYARSVIDELTAPHILIGTLASITKVVSCR